MEKRATLISVCLSLLAMYLVYQYISSQDEELKKAYGMPYKKMVIARKDILQYETIRPTDVEEVVVPNAMVPPGMLETVQDAIEAVAAVPITKGEQILDNKIISKNIYSGVDTNVSLGRRAISIRVTPKSSVGYMVRPGNRVDLAAHFAFKNGATSISEVKVFMQDLLVLAVGRTIQLNAPKGVDQSLLAQVSRDQKTSISKNNPNVSDTLEFVKADQFFQTITLEVTPEQAQKIVYVENTYGDSMSLLLRHADDRVLEGRGTMNFLKIMGDDSWYVKGNRPPIQQKTYPKIKYFDYRGNAPVPVFEGER